MIYILIVNKRFCNWHRRIEQKFQTACSKRQAQVGAHLGREVEGIVQLRSFSGRRGYLSIYLLLLLLRQK